MNKDRNLTMRAPTATLIALTTMMFSIAHATEEGTGTHGSTGVTCIDEKAQLVEYYEPALLPGLKQLKMIESKTDIDTQIDTAIDQLNDEDLQKKLKKYAHTIEALALMNPMIEANWGLIPDANKVPLKPGCKLQTIVYYTSPIDIMYNKKLYDDLSTSAKAANWVHEAVFKLIREVSKGKITASLPARRIVELLFSENPDAKLLKGFKQKYLLKSNLATTTSFNNGMELEYRLPLIQEFTGEQVFFEVKIDEENKIGYPTTLMYSDVDFHLNSTVRNKTEIINKEAGFDGVFSIHGFQCDAEFLRDAQGQLIGGGVIGLQPHRLNPRTIHFIFTDENGDVLLNYTHKLVLPQPQMSNECNLYAGQEVNAFIIPASVLKFEAGVN